jgi:subtilisin family serine protease
MLKQNAPSNDPLSHVQFYLNALNVPQAWNKVTNSKEVIVAVIDDGVDINHPELTYHIWKDPNAKYGASLIKDFV